MSSRQWVFRVKDILNSIEKIELYLDGLTLSEFKKTGLVLDAVIRNFEIIGEASKHSSSSIQKLHPDVPWALMTAMGNNSYS